jgi:hypothetical protein
MSGGECSLAALLQAGGPVRVAVRPCCLVALVGRGASPDSVEAVACAADKPVLADWVTPDVVVESGVAP